MHLEMSSGLRPTMAPQLDDGGHCHGVVEPILGFQSIPLGKQTLLLVEWPVRVIITKQLKSLKKLWSVSRAPCHNFKSWPNDPIIRSRPIQNFLLHFALFCQYDPRACDAISSPAWFEGGIKIKAETKFQKNGIKDAFSYDVFRRFCSYSFLTLSPSAVHFGVYKLN